MNRGERVRMVRQVASQNLELLLHAARAQCLTAVTAEDQSACVRQPETHSRLEAAQPHQGRDSALQVRQSRVEIGSLRREPLPFAARGVERLTIVRLRHARHYTEGLKYQLNW